MFSRQLETRDSTPEERSGLKSEFWGHLNSGQDDVQYHRIRLCIVRREKEVRIRLLHIFF